VSGLALPGLSPKKPPGTDAEKKGPVRPMTRSRTRLWNPVLREGNLTSRQPMRQKIRHGEFPHSIGGTWFQGSKQKCPPCRAGDFFSKRESLDADPTAQKPVPRKIVARSAVTASETGLKDGGSFPAWHCRRHHVYDRQSLDKVSGPSRSKRPERRHCFRIAMEGNVMESVWTRSSLATAVREYLKARVRQIPMDCAEGGGL